MKTLVSRDMLLAIVNVGIVLTAVTMLVVDSYAARPPEKIEDINCSIFDALPILEEVRPFLSDVQPPDQLDFKTRLAYVDDWTKRRSMAAMRLDRLIEVCRVKLAEQSKSGD